MSKRAQAESDCRAPFPLRGYLQLNAAAWLLSLAAFGATWGIVGDVMGVAVFFAALPAGFGVLSVFDALFDRLGRDKGAEPSSPKRQQ